MNAPGARERPPSRAPTPRRDASRRSFGDEPSPHGFAVDHRYSRKWDIHARFGGQTVRGISTAPRDPFVFLFTGGVGPSVGYHDGWLDDGRYAFFGEGRRGDMTFTAGNRAIRDHRAGGRTLLLFLRDGGDPLVTFLGAFRLDGWVEAEAPDQLGRTRRAIVFHLRAAPAPPDE